MAKTFDVTGVITQISDDSCIVSVSTGGLSKSFLFNKTIFYTFGVQCGGSMKNIVEEGMDVELRYKVFHPGNKYCVVAVWLGDKPDIVTEDEAPPSAIYEGNGRVVSFVDSYSLLIQDKNNRTILINKNVVFRDGVLIQKNLPVDEEVIFDAVPLKFEQPLRASYQATCAWIGRKPKLVDRFGLRSSRKVARFLGEEFVVGTVAVVPNDVVALVDVAFDPGLIKVMVFRSSLKQVSERIQDTIDVGDSLCLQLGYRYLFAGHKQWYAVKAYKTSQEVDLGEVINICDERFSERAVKIDTTLSSKLPELSEKINSGSCVSQGPCQQPIPPEQAPLKNSSEKATSKTTMLINTDQALSKPLDVPTVALGPSAVSVRSAASVLQITPIKKIRLSQNRGFLLNCQGMLKVKSFQKIVVKIEHIFGTSEVNGRAGFFPTHIPLDSDQMLQFDNRALRFDAEFVMSPKANCGFRVVRMWDKESFRPRSERLLRSELAILNIETLDNPFAKIVSVPLHDSAIAVVKNVPLLVTLESLRTEEEINLNTSSIETFLNVGDNIAIQTVKRDLDGVAYLQASTCMRVYGEPDSDSKPQMINPKRPTTRHNIWGLGECYRKERVECKHDGYFVDFISSKCPGLALSLNLFEKGKVFINGKLAIPEMLKPYVGCNITFHVCHKHSDTVSSSGKGMYVACAWIGTEPLPKTILREVLEVPKGLVGQCWRYEAVVDSFPLPSHALCSIGCIPCLVQILDQNGGEVLTDLKIGDRIVACFQEDLRGNPVIVFSNELTNLKRASEVAVEDVYRNLTGTIVALPEPEGKIKVADAGFEVSFELCHLRSFKNGSSLKKLFTSVRKKITIGKQVYFSSTKNITGSKQKRPHRAFEVYFIE